MGLAQWLVPTALLVALATIVLLRIQAQPMQPYGTDAAHYIEHSARLDLLDTVDRVDFGPHSSDDLRSFVEDLDGSFPPLLHLVTAALGEFSSHSAEGILWSGLLWLSLLGLSTAGVAFLLSGSSLASAATFCAVVSIPALHASATRYYYDLPMSAWLWAMLFVMLALRHRALVCALAVSLLMFAACLTKWTALPFGLLMLVGATLSTTHPSSRAARTSLTTRLGTAVGAAALVSILIVMFLDLAGNHDSFTAMLGDIGERGEIWGPQGVDANRLDAIFDHIFRDLQPLSAERLRFYGLRSLSSVFSPGICALFLLGTLLWLAFSRRGWPLIVATVLGQSAFLLLRIPPTDERFLLTLAPAIALAAALGWAHLPKQIQTISAALFIGLSVAVAVDFHLIKGDGQGPSRALGVEELDELLRWGLSDSSDQRGWARRDQQRDDHEMQREQLWSELHDCQNEVLQVASERSLVSDIGARGDLYWLRYRSRLAELEEGAPRRRVLLSCDEVNADERALALSAVRGEGPPRPPRCLKRSQWRLEGEVLPAGGERRIAVFSRLGPRLCAELR
ncbi:MAG: hypothetical protein CMP23_15640 [Rickettsiales bacterium]|nr:hypothetical protein [Rickettsiales bacterium]